MIWINFSRLSFVVVLSLLIASCGGQRGVGGSDKAGGKIQEAFETGSRTYSVPSEVIRAAGYLESRFYIKNPSSPSGPSMTLSQVEPEIGYSAFGIPLASLNLDLSRSEADEFELPQQILMYASQLERLSRKDNLSKSISTQEDAVKWALSLARLHRPSNLGQRNLETLFAREILTLMKSGFSTIDPVTSEPIVLEPSSINLDLTAFPSQLRNLLEFDTFYVGDIRESFLFSAQSLPLASPANKPKSIQVVHCPLSISACINQMNSVSSTKSGLQAHYIIPNSQELSPGVLQFARHAESVQVRLPDDSNEKVQDRIIVMVAGLSGRYSGGQRFYSEPTWTTEYQVRLLGSAIKNICAALARIDQDSSIRCDDDEIRRRVTLRAQNQQKYSFGDVVDIDQEMLDLSLSSSSDPTSKVVLALPSDSKSMSVNEPFSASISVPDGTKLVQFSRLVLCQNKNVVWESVSKRHIRTSNEVQLNDLQWFDAGPNFTGRQFFRAQAFSETGKLIGWTQDALTYSDFDRTLKSVRDPEECN